MAWVLCSCKKDISSINDASFHSIATKHSLCWLRVVIRRIVCSTSAITSRRHSPLISLFDGDHRLQCAPKPVIRVSKFFLNSMHLTSSITTEFPRMTTIPIGIFSPFSFSSTASSKTMFKNTCIKSVRDPAANKGSSHRNRVECQ
jgi:hypothetical protein